MTVPRTLRAVPVAVLTTILAAVGAAAVVWGAPSVDGAGVHWAILAVLAAVALAALVLGIRRDGLLSPLVVVGGVFLVYYVGRPLQLALAEDRLTTESFDLYATRLEGVRELSAQEITLYVQSRLSGTLGDAFTRSLLVQLLFLVCLLLGYRLGAGHRLASWLSTRGARYSRLDLSWIIAGWLAIGVLGQLAVLATIGGVGAASSSLGTQGNLAVGFAFLVILNFYTAGLILWMCWHTPVTRGQRVLLALAILELVGFYALLGSRTLVLIPLMMVLFARNEIGRPVRARGLVMAIAFVALFSSVYLSFRESAHEQSFSETLSRVPSYAVDFRPLLNASPVYDQVLFATNYIPERSPYRYGGELAQGVLGQVPSFLSPSKPESNDTSFRKLIWGERFGAGRPIGAAAEGYRDFGFPGVALAGVLLGILVRGLGGLRRKAGGVQGREVRTAAYVIATMLLFESLIGSYSLVFGLALEILIPMTLALVLVARRART